MNKVELHHLLNKTSVACAPNAAFVTLIANETYVDGALCLRRALLRVRSSCPIVLVVADPLPRDAMAALAAEYNSSNIHKLSDLRLRLDKYEQRQLARRVREDEQGARRLQQILPSPYDSIPRRLAGGSGGDAGAAVELRNTRQLHRAGGWAKRTHQKLLLFAMRGYSKLAFLDIDMLVTRNIDALLEQPAFAAVAALPYSTSSFNSGVFVFEPSLVTAAALDDLSQRATFKALKKRGGGAIVADGEAASRQIRIKGAGERFQLTDQSILNHHYQGRWHALPFGYNLGIKVRQVSPKMWSKMEVAIVHFVHRPKPWEATLADPTSPISGLTRRLGIAPLVRAWRYRCAGEPKPTTTALSAQDQLLFADT